MIKLILGDCIERMRQLQDRSVDLVLTDPPYGITACKWDSVIPFKPMWDQIKRITKPGCAIVLFGSQPFTSALVMSNPEMFKYEWIWGKGRGTGFQIVKYKPLVSHENILVFGSGSVTYNPQMRERDEPRVSKNNGRTRQMLVSNGNAYSATEALDQKYPITELQFPNNNQRDKIHPTQKPVELMEYLIKTYSNEDDLVLDFTMGSGTTGIACMNLDRRFIGIEKDPVYFEAAKQRILDHNLKLENES